MFCKNCGNQVKDGAAFCPKCGNTLKISENNAAQKKQEAPAVSRIAPSQSAVNIAQLSTPQNVKPAAPQASAEQTQNMKSLRSRAWFAPVSSVLCGISFIGMSMAAQQFISNLDPKENINSYNLKVTEINNIANVSAVGIAFLFCLLMYFLAGFGIPSKTKKQIFPYVFSSYAFGIIPLSISSALINVIQANFDIHNDYNLIINLCISIAFEILFAWIAYMVTARGLGTIEIPVKAKKQK